MNIRIFHNPYDVFCVRTDLQHRSYWQSSPVYTLVRPKVDTVSFSVNWVSLDFENKKSPLGKIVGM